MQGAPSIPGSHPHRTTSAKCRINTVVSPDDRHIVARNMQILINILRKNCTSSWLYLQESKDILITFSCGVTLNKMKADSVLRKIARPLFWHF